MKRMSYFLVVFVVLFIADLSLAQGPYNMSIGTSGSPGYLNFTTVYSLGNIRGDDGTFNDGSSEATTIWNICWFVYDVNNSQHYFMDTYTAPSHADHRATDGTIDTAGLPTQLSNTGISFPNSPGLTADMTMQLSSPQAGDARLSYTWTFHNANPLSMYLRFILFVDNDIYHSGTYTDELASIADSSYTAWKVLGAGENDGSGNVNLNQGIKADCDKVVDYFFGLSSDNGASYYWSSSMEYAGMAPEDVFEIHDDYKNIIQNDADTNYLTDSGKDVGMALQINLTVPGSGSETVNLYLDWGLNETLSGGALPTPTPIPTPTPGARADDYWSIYW